MCVWVLWVLWMLWVLLEFLFQCVDYFLSIWTGWLFVEAGRWTGWRVFMGWWDRRGVWVLLGLLWVLCVLGVLSMLMRWMMLLQLPLPSHSPRILHSCIQNTQIILILGFLCVEYRDQQLSIPTLLLIKRREQFWYRNHDKCDERDDCKHSTIPLLPQIHSFFLVGILFFIYILARLAVFSSSLRVVLVNY